MKEQIALVCRNVGNFTIRNGPTILTISASVGVVATAWTSAKAGVKCAQKLEELEYSSKQKPTMVDKAKTVTPHAVAPTICGAATIACIIGAHKMHIQREAAIAAAYTILEGRLKKYQEQVISEIGEKKEKRLNDQAAQKIVDETYSQNGLNVIQTKHGNILFMDSFSGRYFYSSYEHIERAKIALAAMAQKELCVCLNDFYDFLEIPGIEGGKILGWNICDVSDQTFDNVIPIVTNRTCLTPTPEQFPCTIVDYEIEPIIDFDRCF